jgi:proteasome lid subunit RPN8/RPN11
MNRTLSPRSERPLALTFAPLAWLKLQFFCHQASTEIGGFGISAENDPLSIEQFQTVKQQATSVTVAFDDAAVADFFDDCVDRGLSPSRFARVWLHTHPGASVDPSLTDQDTFYRVFGSCDWSVMFILGRTGRTYARLAFSAGPGGSLMLPVQVDWSRWPGEVKSGSLAHELESWRAEFAANIQPLGQRQATPSPSRTAPPASEPDYLADLPWWWGQDQELQLVFEGDDELDF